MSDLYKENGYSLIELIVVIVIIGILAGVAMNKLGDVDNVTRFEETRREMDMLAFAIAGNPDMVSQGIRTNFGYIGDIGALPTNWDDLVSNPGGYTTWNGPYIQDKFASSATNSQFKLDGWAVQYSNPNSYQFSSNGNGQTITRELANSNSDLLYNQVIITISDLDFTPPGNNYVDSVKFLLTYPNGTGGLTTVSKNPTANGLASFDSIPIGIHILRTVIMSENDTLIRKININPGQDYYADITWNWLEVASGGSLILRPNGPYAAYLSNSGSAWNYQCVNEIIADDDGSYVVAFVDVYLFDIHELDDPPGGYGSITGVTVHYRAKKDSNQDLVCFAEAVLLINANPVYGMVNFLTPYYENYSNKWVENPNTSAPWTWTEITELRAGIALGSANGHSVYCTQLWVEVEYEL